MDNNHELNLNTTLEYTNCPPASGPHFNAAGRGPIKRNFYGPAEQTHPGGWVHNLEHGFIVAAYSCEGSCPSDGDLRALREWWEAQPQTPGAQQCQVPNKVMVVRFDKIATRYAVLSWDRALLMDQWDAAAATEFAKQRIEQAPAPEPNSCA